MDEDLISPIPPLHPPISPHISLHLPRCAPPTWTRTSPRSGTTATPKPGPNQLPRTLIRPLPQALALALTLPNPNPGQVRPLSKHAHRVAAGAQAPLLLPLHLPYISPTSPLHLPHISPTSPLQVVKHRFYFHFVDADAPLDQVQATYY